MRRPPLPVAAAAALLLLGCHLAGREAEFDELLSDRRRRAATNGPIAEFPRRAPSVSASDTETRRATAGETAPHDATVRQVAFAAPGASGAADATEAGETTRQGPAPIVAPGPTTVPPPTSPALPTSGPKPTPAPIPGAAPVPVPVPAPAPEPGASTMPVEWPVDPGDGFALRLEQVVESIYASYPLLESAYRERTIAFGKTTSAFGEFDTKLKGSSENQPLGFYETYRQKLGVEQPLFFGGEAFAQYRIGRGQFEPWYLERQTNAGGEFKAGLVVPLLRNTDIDARRSELWQAQLGRGAVEPEIRGQLVEYVRQGSYAYWEWVAAGQTRRVARDLLDNALRRDDALRKRAEKGDVEPIAVTDNERLVVSRRTKLVETEQKLRQSAFKLALFHRDGTGNPAIAGDDLLPPGLPAPILPTVDVVESDVQRAWDTRPEMEVLDFARRNLTIELEQARNLTLPSFDAGIAGSQDMGEPTSKKRDKSEFELEAGLVLEVPLQRRKARGKIAQTEGKLAQLNAKTRFTRDKIAAEVRTAAVAVEATFRRYEQARRSLELARTMERAEDRKFDLGDSDLFLVNAREKQTAEAAQEVVEALLDHARARADYQAALGRLVPVAGQQP